MARINNRRALGDLGNLVDGLSDGSAIPRNANKILPENHQRNFAPLNRPITRQYGAILAKDRSTKQATGKENDENFWCGTKQRRTLSPKETKIQVQETHEQIDVPMEEKEADEELKQINEMDFESSSSSSTLSGIQETESCEIEMDEAESAMLNIDEADQQNPLAAADYVEDIYSHYRKTEITSCVPADYMLKQNDINHRMRAILVDWLIEVHHKFDLMQETLFLAINLIDRFLSVQNVMRKSLQLVGITSMLLACKYEEVYVPALEDFVIISDRAYTRDDVLKMERSILNTLQFNMSLPTAFVFLRRFLKAAESDLKLEMASFYLLELCLVEYRMLKFPPSLLSAAALYTGRSMLKLSPLWDKTLTFHSTYSEEQLQECVELMTEIQPNAGVGKLTSVYRKYSVSKYSCVAKLMNSSLLQQL